jgi:phenylpyruvate tautomerase PptA (4-oxalocrotonate tautomerase family)
MPLIDLAYPADTFTDEERTALVDELTTTLLRAEGAPNNDFFRSITWAFVNEHPEGTLLQAGRPVTEPIFRVQVSVPEGALNAERKAKFVSEATRVIRDAAGIREEDGLRVWVLIRDVPEGNWGAAGNIVHFEQLRQAAIQAREQAGEPVATAS